MSVAALSAVFEHSKAEGGARLVLLALADRADEDGACWPSVADVARRTRLTERQVRRCFQALRSIGELHIDPGGGRHRPNRYRLTLTSTSGFPERRNPDICDTKPGHLRPKTLTPTSAEPSGIVNEPRIPPQPPRSTGGARVGSRASHHSRKETRLDSNERYRDQR